MMVDSGASVNIMDAKTYRSIPNAAPLKPIAIRIYAVQHQPGTPTARRTCCYCEVKTTRHGDNILRCKNRQDASTISYDTAREFGLIKPTLSTVTTAPATTKISVSDTLIKDYPELFTGIGKLASHQAELHIDKTVQPVAQHHRRIPFHLRQQVERLC